MSDGSLPIVVTPEPFGRNAFDLSVVEGLSVRGMLVEAVKAGLPISALDRTEIYIDGARLDREGALDHRLKAGQVVNVVVEPLGGGGGRKDIGQILLTVAVIAVSAWVGGGAGGMIASKLLARAAAAAITMGGQALIGAMYAPDRKETKTNDRYALQAASNQYRQWGSFPLALGEVVVGPDLAAKTFTQTRGEDVWIYGILGLHYGPCEVSDIKIGDTLVSTMGAGDFQMVQHLAPGPRTFSLYPNDVDQLDLQEELQATPSSATPIVRAASSEGQRFDIDFFLPGGLHLQKDDGRVLAATVSVTVRYRPIDADGAATGPWQSGPTLSRTSTTKDPWRITHSVSAPLGLYEFELTRSLPADDNAKRRDDIYVTAIKAVAFRKPINDETLSVIEFAVRATAISQGTLAPITCRIIPKCPTWTGSAWGPEKATSNPAALVRWLLTGPAPAKPLTSLQADVRLRTWSALCEQYDWSAHLYLTETRTQAEVMQLLGQMGRASLFWDGSQIAASPWVEKAAPRQLFTGANLRDHNWSIVYPEPVHALRVEFQNIEQSGEADELYVYADGYGEVANPAASIKAATLIEALRLEGQVTPNRAYRDGRWSLGQRLHQRRIDTWTADVENLASQLGDRARLAWRRVDGADVRVQVRRWTGGLVSGLRLTQPVEMVAGMDYAVDLRTKSGLFVAVPIQTVPGLSREIVFAAPRNPALCPAGGDLIAFGVANRVSEDVEIIGIAPGENLTAVMTGVRYVAPLLMAGETGPIPPLQSRLTGERSANPPQPILLGVQQDANGVRVSFDVPTWRGSPITGFSVRWRSKVESGEASAWSALPSLAANARELLAPPLREAPVVVGGVDETRVEVEIVANTAAGRSSVPLLVTVVQPVVSQPSAVIWEVVAKPAAADGTSQPILIVTGRVDDPAVTHVRIAVGLTGNEAGPWTEAYFGPMLTQALEISGLVGGVEYYVAITHLSAQGIPSKFLVIGPRVPGALKAEDVVALGGTPAAEITGRLAAAEGLVAATSQRVDELTDVVESATGEFGQALILVGQQVQAAEDAATASDSRATAAAAAAGEALTYRNQTSSIRDETITARDETRTSAKASSDQAAALLYSRFNSRETWTSTAAAGGPVADMATTTWPIVDDPDLGPCLEITSAAEATVTHKGFVFGIGRQHRLRLRAKCVTPGATTPAFRDARLNAALGYLTRGSMAQPVATAGQIVDWSQDVNTGQRLSGTPGAENCRFGFSCSGTWRLALFSIEDTTESIAAAAQAATALVQSSAASQSAAEAAINASVAASVGGGGVMRDPTFNAWPAANARPDNVAAPTGLTISRQTTDLIYGDRAMRLVDPGTGNAFVPIGAAGFAPASDALHWVVEYVVTVNSGDLKRFGVQFRANRTTGYYGATVDLAANHPTTTPGVTYRWSKMFAIAPLGGAAGSPTTCQGWFYTNLSSFSGGAFSAKDVTLHKLQFRPATPEEIAAGTELPTVGAQAALALSVASDAQTKLSEAQFSATAQAGSDPGQVYVKAGPLGSVAGFIASSIKLATVVGGSVIEVVKVIGTSAHFAGKVFIGALQEITLDPTLPGILWKVGGATLVIGKLPNQSLLFWFGPTVTTASMTKANGTFWLDTTGQGYFGGGLKAGLLTNGLTVTSLAAGATADTGRFGSNGGTITTVLSYSASGNAVYYDGATSPLPRPANTNGTTSATVRLDRGVNGGALSAVQTLSASGTWTDTVPDDGYVAGQGWRHDYFSGVAGSLTYTDPQTVAQDRQYKATITARSAGPRAVQTQTLAILCIEG